MSRRSRAKCDMRSARNANSRNAETAKYAEVFAKGAKRNRSDFLFFGEERGESSFFIAQLLVLKNYCAFVVPMIYQSAPTTMIW